MAESVQEQGLSAGMSELSREHGQAVGGRRVKVARPDGAVAQTQFRGVRRKPSGRYGAQIWVPSLRANVTLGTFDTAEEAAKAYHAAAVELLPCTPGCADKKPQQKKAVKLHPRAPGWVTKKKKAGARSDAWTKFRGVYRMRNGKYGAQIRPSGAKARTWLGTFESAEDAARAYDDAAVKLHGAWAVTNFKQPRDREGDDAAAEEEVKKGPAARLDARSEFRGVYRTVSGNYGVQIRAKASRLCLGTFVDVEEAARAYDAPKVKLLGAAARTNFEQPLAPTGTAAHDAGEESPMDLLNDDFPEMPALDFLSHGCVSAGAQPDDLWADLPPVERQQLVDMDFSDVAP